MIIGFSRHFGKGGSGPVLDYLTGYLVNGEARNPKPEIVRGDRETVCSIIDSLPFKRRYTSGVLAFHPEDRVTPEMQDEIMDRFEDAAFAGLPSDRRAIIWVKHQDKGRVELHFVVPRCDLGTGRSFNIAPPTPASRHLFDTLRSAINLRYGFRDPGDPSCVRAASIPAHVAKLSAQAKRLGRSAKKDIRQVIADQILDQARGGAITCRVQVVDFLKEHGFTVTRAGLNYITIACPDSGERVRLKGIVFSENFSSKDLACAIAPRDPARLLTLDRRLQRLVEKRASYHRARYGLEDNMIELARLKEETKNDRTRNPVTPNRPPYREGSPGPRPAIPAAKPGINPAIGRFDQVGRNLDQASRCLGHAGIQFSNAIAKSSRRLTDLVATRRRQAMNRALFIRYGIAQRGSGNGSRDIERNELELDLSDTR